MLKILEHFKKRIGKIICAYLQMSFLQIKRPADLLQWVPEPPCSLGAQSDMSVTGCRGMNHLLKFPPADITSLAKVVQIYFLNYRLC